MMISSGQFKNIITISFNTLVSLLESLSTPIIFINFLCLFQNLIQYFKLTQLTFFKLLTVYLKIETFIFQKIRPSIHSVTIAPILFSINYSEA